jgi:hypothetical protein
MKIIMQPLTHITLVIRRLTMHHANAKVKVKVRDQPSHCFGTLLLLENDNNTSMHLPCPCFNNPTTILVEQRRHHSVESIYFACYTQCS